LVVLGLFEGEGVGGGLDAVGEVELVEDVVEVAVDGAFGDAELVGDLAVAEALGDEVEDFLLAGAEGIGGPGLGGGVVGGVADEGDEAGESGGGDDGLAAGDGPDGSEDVVDAAGLGDVADGAGLDGLVDELGLVAVDGEYDDLDLGQFLLDEGGGLEPVAAGHLDVHEDDVGAELAGLLEGFEAIGGVAEDGDVGADLEEGA
jgi:hypothetical protein